MIPTKASLSSRLEDSSKKVIPCHVISESGQSQMHSHVCSITDLKLPDNSSAQSLLAAKDQPILTLKQFAIHHFS